MERLTANLPDLQNQQIEKSSNSPQTSTRTIPRDRHAAIFSIINLSRGSLGWSLKSAAELDEQIQVWARTLDEYHIPSESLERLWRRARDMRITRLQQGLEMPDFTVELLAACWVGANGLKAEMDQERIDAGRTLTGHAQSQCRKCFGAGREFMFDSNGRTLGVIGQCDHQGERRIA